MNRAFGLSGGTTDRRFETRQSQGYLPRGHIDGLILSNDATDATNDIAIAAGSCRSTTNIVDGAVSTLARDQIDLDLPINIIKQLDVAWAPENYDREGFSGGDRSGGRSASAVSNTTWHMFAIGARDLPTDVLFHDAVSASSALPSGYTAWRMIGSVVRSGGALLAFTQDNDCFVITTPTTDISNATPGTTAVTGTLASVPTGIKVWVDFHAQLNSAAAAFYVSSLDQTDSAASLATGVAPLATAYAGGGAFGGHGRVRTNTSAQVRYRCTANAAFYLSPISYLHPRGRNS